MIIQLFKVLIDVLIHLLVARYKKSLYLNKAAKNPLYSNKGSFFSRGEQGERALHLEDAHVQLCGEQRLPGFHSGAEMLGRHMRFECLL